jgi:hypothetical protein
LSSRLLDEVPAGERRRHGCDARAYCDVRLAGIDRGQRVGHHRGGLGYVAGDDVDQRLGPRRFRPMPFAEPARSGLTEDLERPLAAPAD